MRELEEMFDRPYNFVCRYFFEPTKYKCISQMLNNTIFEVIPDEDSEENFPGTVGFHVDGEIRGDDLIFV